ncbi:MAG: hypothetical protein Edafosvirus1_114 [Edafosvirus sp.]|uniref:Uncharacterized protein n=1 Tax=Edafosvirus sp. TaxID=2487765 RepID=A0A3G4ZVY9_9VIRU|nr:MAG: hypothetical protein Edafosvirus1_114 [Edafosvirus sp.]
MDGYALTQKYENHNTDATFSCYGFHTLVQVHWESVLKLKTKSLKINIIIYTITTKMSGYGFRPANKSLVKNKKILQRRSGIPFEYNKCLFKKIKEFISKFGAYYNKPCNWDIQDIFQTITKMKLYDPITLKIPERKFYWIMNKKDDDTGKYYHEGGWCTTIGHTIPTPNAIDELTKIIGRQKTVSVGSCMSLFEYMLQCKGCNVTCVDIDICPFSYTNVLTVPPMCDNIFKKLKLNDINVLLLIWPQPDDYKSVSEYGKTGYDERAINSFSGDTVIFIGHFSNDVVGSSNFKQILKQEFKFMQEISLPFCIEENYMPKIYVYTRKPKKMFPYAQSKKIEIVDN